ncbi:hypothetical protein [uncultured Ruminococcus sp.]|uniref:hypothetical protein n=1 Tax=uncultured Ruminococcus sp. TaxID=165186 RepID=UPI0025CE0B47|nr:hypothetical protein [uncultured Ruminococcus sp.]
MRRFAMAALAALMAVSLAGCGDKEKNDGSGRVKKMPPETVTTAEEDITAEEDAASAEEVSSAVTDDAVTAVPQSEISGESAAVTEVTAPAESGAESKAEAVQTAGAPFTFKADESKWTVTADEVSAAITYNADDIQYAKGNCTIMINARTVPDMEDRLLSDLADAIIDSKGLTDSVKVNTRGDSVLNGHDAYSLDCLYTVKDVEFDLDITVMAEGTQVIEVWVISYKDCTEAMQANYDAVLDTIAFA